MDTHVQEPLWSGGGRAYPYGAASRGQADHQFRSARQCTSPVSGTNGLDGRPGERPAGREDLVNVHTSEEPRRRGPRTGHQGAPRSSAAAEQHDCCRGPPTRAPDTSDDGKVAAGSLTHSPPRKRGLVGERTSPSHPGYALPHAVVPYVYPADNTPKSPRKGDSLVES